MIKLQKHCQQEEHASYGIIHVGFNIFCNIYLVCI